MALCVQIIFTSREITNFFRNETRIPFPCKEVDSAGYVERGVSLLMTRLSFSLLLSISFRASFRDMPSVVWLLIFSSVSPSWSWPPSALPVTSRTNILQPSTSPKSTHGHGSKQTGQSMATDFIKKKGLFSALAEC